MTNRTADDWGDSRDTAKSVVESLAIGDRISYEQAEDLGDRIWADLLRALKADGMRADDDGDGYKIVASN